MSVQVRPAGPRDFVAYVDGLDLRRQIPDGAVADIEGAINRFAVLVFRGQDISDEDQLAFSRRFGVLEERVEAKSAARSRLSRQINDISNVDENGVILAERDARRRRASPNQLWHSDSSYRPVTASYSFLSARRIPDEKGDTQFADMRAAYDALDAVLKAQIEDLVTEHDILYSLRVLGFSEEELATNVEFEQVRVLPPARHRLVRTHPGSGRKSLFLSSDVTGVVGWHPVDGRTLVRELTEHATQRQFVFSHKWRAKDLVMWDNRCTMHRGRPYDESQVREMHRTSVSAALASAEPEPA